MADERSRRIQDLQYNISFAIPASKTSPIRAEEKIIFQTSGIHAALQIDFKEDASKILSVKVNEQPTAIQFSNEHILIDANLLKTGLNQIQIQFIAGDGALNRNNDYCYALLVPERARTLFPCFDQPDLKARYTLSISAPAGWKVLANGKLKDSATKGSDCIWHFNTTDLLPTYLFSFTAGKYSGIQKTEWNFCIVKLIPAS